MRNAECEVRNGEMRNGEMRNSKSQGDNPKSRPLAFIALGSNLGDSHQIILRAMDCLERLSDRPLLRSSLWRTSPVECPPDSPPFINAVVGLNPRPDESPESLVAKLQEIETEFGRHAKKALNEPRPLDLDLVCFGALTRNTARLTLPHPRAHERRFVLAPLVEIAPDLILPGQAKTARQLLAELKSAETVARLS